MKKLVEHFIARLRLDYSFVDARSLEDINKERLAAAVMIETLWQEIEVLREYGNKDCTAMADERLSDLRCSNNG